MPADGNWQAWSSHFGVSSIRGSFHVIELKWIKGPPRDGE
jgi:hypothetical protein